MITFIVPKGRVFCRQAIMDLINMPENTLFTYAVCQVDGFEDFRMKEGLLSLPTIRVYENGVKILDPVTGEYREIRIEEDLIDIRVYDRDAFEEVKDYRPIIQDLMEGNIELHDLVDIASRYNMEPLKNTVMMSAVDSAETTKTIILQ